MFAVQHGGWCAASATAAKTFDKYGKSTSCKDDGEGGPWGNQVYVIKGKVAFGYTPVIYLGERHNLIIFLCIKPGFTLMTGFTIR